MRPVIVAGPPASGKTSVMKRVIPSILAAGHGVSVVKFDCRPGTEEKEYASIGIQASVVLGGDLCPDHAVVLEIGTAYIGAACSPDDFLVMETAGLCERCSPFLERVPAVTVLSAMANIQAPARMKALVGKADVVVVTRTDLISQAEREVLFLSIAAVNPAAPILAVDGLTGEGSAPLVAWFLSQSRVRLFDEEKLRYALPRGSCTLCSGGLA